MVKRKKNLDKQLPSLPLIELKIPEPPKGCDRYYISDIAFTMGWINTFGTSDFEAIMQESGIKYSTILITDAYRGEVGVFKLEDSDCGLVIVSSSGLMGADNYIMFCGVEEKLQFKILMEIARYHFKKFLPEVRGMLNYKNKLMKKSKKGEITVINPALLSASERVTLENLDHAVKKITKFMEGGILILSINELKEFIKEINKLLGF